jgi:uncharacterized protein YkwD
LFDRFNLAASAPPINSSAEDLDIAATSFSMSKLIAIGCMIAFLAPWVPHFGARGTGSIQPDDPRLKPEQSVSPTRSPRTAFDPTTACDEVLKAHNRERAGAKLPALAKSTRLQAAALRHAKDMAAHGKMTHKGTDGTSPPDRIKAERYRYRRAGENIAAGSFTIDALMKGWMESPPHKRNILGSFSQIGVAYATAENGKRYWCVTFGLPARR